MATKKITKKPTAKSVLAKKSSVRTPAKKSVANVSASSSTKSNSPTVPFKIKKSYIILAVAVLALGFLIYNYKSFFVAAIVNGQPLTRLAVVKETEKQAGKAALDNLVRNTLIEQEAAKTNTTVTDKEINDEIKKAEDSVKKQGRKMDDVLKTQGLTREDLRKLIRLDRLVNKMVGKDIKVTDKEISAYIEANKEALPQDQSEAQLKTTVSAQLKQQALNEKVQAWLANLQTKAKIQYFVQY